MIISTQLLNLIPGAILGILTATGAIQVWHIYVLSLITASLQVLGGPARQAIVPSLVPPSHLLNAVTLTTMMQQGTQLIGPFSPAISSISSVWTKVISSMRRCSFPQLLRLCRYGVPDNRNGCAERSVFAA
jgi:Transmembrane secretion effector